MSFFLYKPPAFYIGLVLIACFIVLGITGIKRSKRNFKIHRAFGIITLGIGFVHAIVAMLTYLGIM